jgi:hypothetical protein
LWEKQDVSLKVWQEKQERLYKQQGATRRCRPKLYWTIQQESSQMTQFLSIWFDINACTACSDFNPSGHDSYPLPTLAQLLRKVSSLNHVVHL